MEQYCSSSCSLDFGKLQNQFIINLVFLLHINLSWELKHVYWTSSSKVLFWVQVYVLLNLSNFQAVVSTTTHREKWNKGWILQRLSYYTSDPQNIVWYLTGDVKYKPCCSHLQKIGWFA